MGKDIWEKLAKQVKPVAELGKENESDRSRFRKDQIKKRERYLQEVAAALFEPILANINEIVFEGRGEIRYEFPSKSDSLSVERGYDRYVSGQQEYLTTDIVMCFYKEQAVQTPVFPFFAITLFEKDGDGLSKARVAFSSSIYKEFRFDSGMPVGEVEKYLASNIRTALIPSVSSN